MNKQYCKTCKKNVKNLGRHLSRNRCKALKERREEERSGIQTTRKKRGSRRRQENAKVKKELENADKEMK